MEWKKDGSGSIWRMNKEKLIFVDVYKRQGYDGGRESETAVSYSGAAVL